MPNSEGGRVWSLAQANLNVKVKGQGHQGQKMRLALPAAYKWYALAANNVTQQQTGPFCRCRGGADFGSLRAVCLVKHL